MDIELDDVFVSNQDVELSNTRSFNRIGLKKGEAYTLVGLNDDSARLAGAFASGYRLSERENMEMDVPLALLKGLKQGLWLKPQTLDGIDYTPDEPCEEGHYWFVGFKGRHNPKGIHVLLVNVKKHQTGFTYWFGGDMAFSKHDKMVGLWAKAYYPNLPFDDD